MEIVLFIVVILAVLLLLPAALEVLFIIAADTHDFFKNRRQQLYKRPGRTLFFLLDFLAVLVVFRAWIYMLNTQILVAVNICSQIFYLLLKQTRGLFSMNYLENWEYAVPEGWLKTDWWDNLVWAVGEFATRHGTAEEPFEILDVKEKWGQLRIYAAFSYDSHEEWTELMNSYEKMSEHTCMTCGSYIENIKDILLVNCPNCIEKTS